MPFNELPEERVLFPNNDDECCSSDDAPVRFVVGNIDAVDSAAGGDMFPSSLTVIFCWPLSSAMLPMVSRRHRSAAFYHRVFVFDGAGGVKSEGGFLCVCPPCPLKHEFV